MAPANVSVESRMSCNRSRKTRAALKFIYCELSYNCRSGIVAFVFLVAIELIISKAYEWSCDSI